MPEATACRALRESCNVSVASAIFSEEAQFKLRQRLNVDVPLKFWDSDVKVFVVILPLEAVSKVMVASGPLDGALRFDVPASDAGRTSVPATVAPSQPASAAPS